MATAQYDLEEMSIREIIGSRLEELGVSRWRLAHSEELRGVSPSTTFRFLNGEHDAMSMNVATMLRACGLRIVPDRKTPGWVRELKRRAQ